MYTVELPGKYFFDEGFIDLVYEVDYDIIIRYTNHKTIIEILDEFVSEEDIRSEFFKLVEDNEYKVYKNTI